MGREVSTAAATGLSAATWLAQLWPNAASISFSADQANTDGWLRSRMMRAVRWVLQLSQKSEAPSA
jgi:hypothetical protein